ncbi:MAG: DUF1887 family CARF protein [Oceanospirillaceae bacterium]
MNKPYQVQLLIISDQPSSNLCPLLDSRLTPDEIMLATPKGSNYQDFQRWMIEVCQPLGIKCSVLDLPDYEKIATLRHCFEQLVEQRVALGQQLTLNSTCGEKPIAIIAHEVFVYHDLPVFYVKHDWLHWLHNPHQLAAISLEDRIKIPAFLNSHGLNVTALKRGPITLQMRDIASHWLSQAKTYTKSMGILNYYAAKAQHSLYCNISEQHNTAHSPFSMMLDQLSDAGLIQLAGNKLTFSDEESRFFANGGWLEDQVFSELLLLRKELPKLQDIARNVEIEWRESNHQHKVKNELDVIALYDNRLLVIECKTKRFDKGEAKNVVYKLGAMIKHLGGIKAVGAIVSFQHISAKHCERAQLLDIYVCEKQGLANLPRQLRHFLEECN